MHQDFGLEKSRIYICTSYHLKTVYMNTSFKIGLGAVMLLCCATDAWSSPMALKVPERQPATITWNGVRKLPDKATDSSSMKAKRKSYGEHSPFAKRAATGIAPRRAMDCGATIYGYRSYPFRYGFYEIGDDAPELKYSDPLFASNWRYASNGWYDNGKVCGYSFEMEGPQSIFYNYFEIDFSTNEVLKFDKMPTDGAVMVKSVLNPDDNYIYGIGGVPLSTYGFYRAPKDKPDELELLCPFSSLPPYDVEGAQPSLVALCFNPADGGLYGMNINMEFVRIATDGKYTVISTMPDAEQFDCETFTGMVYSPVDRKFYYSAITEEFTSQLFTITPQGKFNFVCNLVDEDGYDFIFSYLFTTDSRPDGTTPEVPEIVTVDFDRAATSGSATFRMPSSFGDGSPLTETINCVALVDGMEYSHSNVGAGKETVVNYSDLSEGMHRFGVYAEVNGKKSAVASTSRYIGHDKPCMPQNVVISGSEVTWDGVTAGVNGGYIDVSALRYEVSINGERIGETSETHISSGISADSPFARYKASVTAVSGAMRSEPGESAAFLYGKAMELPVRLLPQRDEYELFTKCKSEEVYWDWRYRADWDELSPVFVECTYNNGDVWLFLPPVHLESPDKCYVFSVECSLFDAEGPNAVHDFEVALYSKPSPDSRISEIAGRFRPSVNAIKSGTAFDKLTGLVKIDQPGDYYIGVHAIQRATDGVRGNCGFRNFEIYDDNITTSSPEIPSDLNVSDAGNGELAAVVSFTFPEKSISGEKLPEDMELTATITGKEAVVCKGKPGEKRSTKVPTVQGENLLAFKMASETLNGETVYKRVFTGVHVPAMPESFDAVVSDDLTRVSLRWNPVTVSIDGGYLNPETVTYRIEAIGFRDEEGEEQFLNIAKNLSANSYDFIYPEDAVPGFCDIYVVAENEAGNCGQGIGRKFYLGKSYELPFKEEFEAGPYCTTTAPWIMYDEEGYYQYVEFRVFPLEIIDGNMFPGSEDEWAFALHSSFADNLGTRLGLPRFSSMNQTEATLKLTTLAGERTPDFHITATVDDSGTIYKIGDIPATDGSRSFKDYSFVLPSEVLQRPWVQLYLDFNFHGEDDAAVIRRVNITGASSSVDLVTENSRGEIKAGKGCVIIRNLEGENVSVVRPDGAIVLDAVIDSPEFSHSLEPGIYIVNAGATQTKIAVR